MQGAVQCEPKARAAWDRSHYMRDVTFGEDASRIRKGSGPEIMAALRNAAIGFLRITGATKNAETVRGHASQVQTLFARLDILN
jgi:predicted transposase YbfD/YdcC